ncbi:MAG: iron-sulfur cluster assembly scaffold protein [Geminicoccaceae bacterium]
MSQQLYNDAIVSTAKANQGAGRLPAATHSATCDNPLCGDRVTLDLQVEDGRVGAVAQKTRGCLLTQAAAAVIAAHAAGATREDLRRVAQEVEALLQGSDDRPDWPELEMFRPVQAVKSRHDCVLLPFHAVDEAFASPVDRG